MKKKIKNERKKEEGDNNEDDDNKDQLTKRSEKVMNQLLEMNENEEDLRF